MRTLPSREHDRLQEALRAGELVVCLGPGIRAGAALPVRIELVRAVLAAAQELTGSSGTRRIEPIELELSRGAESTGVLVDLERVFGEG